MKTRRQYLDLKLCTPLGVLWKYYSSAFDKLEDYSNRQEYEIGSYMWAANIKKSVEDFVNFVDDNILRISQSSPESPDKYEDFFSEAESTPILKDKLDSLDKTYNAYLAFNNLLPSLIQETEQLIAWLLRTIIVCIAFAIWGVVGVLIENTQFFSGLPYFWASATLLLFVVGVCLWGITKQNRHCGTIRSSLRREKSKYASLKKGVP